MNNVHSLSDLPKLPVPHTLYSYCLFESDQMRDEKHITPFLTHLKSSPTIAARTILFATEYFKFLAPHVGFFVPVPQREGYANHLDRYLATHTVADHVIFLGTDQPNVFPDFKRCLDIAHTFRFQFVGAFMESHPRTLIGGRCFIGSRTLGPHRDNFSEELDTHRKHTAAGWNCDEDFISAFVQGYSPPAVFNAPAGVFKAETQRFIIERLLTTPTIIVREPNCYFK